MSDKTKEIIIDLPVVINCNELTVELEHGFGTYFECLGSVIGKYMQRDGVRYRAIHYIVDSENTNFPFLENKLSEAAVATHVRFMRDDKIKGMP